MKKINKRNYCPVDSLQKSPTGFLKKVAQASSISWDLEGKDFTIKIGGID